MKINFNKKLLLEFSSVFFAVFLGLMLNQWNDKRNHNKLAEQSKINLLSEIVENNTKVQNMIASHQDALLKVDSILVQLDSLSYSDDIFLELEIQLVSSTSWETAKLTQAIAFMDIELVTNIAGIYSFQQIYESMMKDYVLRNMYSKPNNRDKEYMEKLKNFLDVIIPMETSLIEYYSYIQTDVLVQ